MEGKGFTPSSKTRCFLLSTKLARGGFSATFRVRVCRPQFQNGTVGWTNFYIKSALIWHFLDKTCQRLKLAKSIPLARLESLKKYTLAGGTSPATFTMEEPPPPVKACFASLQLPSLLRGTVRFSRGLLQPFKMRLFYNPSDHLLRCFLCYRL